MPGELLENPLLGLDPAGGIVSAAFPFGLFFCPEVGVCRALTNSLA